MSFCIAIEGVGMRQSVAVVSDERGKILSATRVPWGISLYTISREDLRDRLWRIVRTALYDAGCRSSSISDATMSIGLTGVTFPYDACVELPEELSCLFGSLGVLPKKLICTGDAEIVFASHAQTDRGSAIVCHMGSSAYVTSKTLRVRYGGWGPALGDEGSGFWMGRTALRAIGEECNDEREESILWKEVRDWLANPDSGVPEWREASLLWSRRLQRVNDRKFDARTAICGFSHELAVRSVRLWRCVASGLTAPTMRAWAKGDKVAESIAIRATQALRDQLQSACKTAGVNIGDGPLVLYGGVIAHHPAFRDLLVKQVRCLDRTTEVSVLAPADKGTMRPVLGALLFALGDSETQKLRLPERKIVDLVMNGAVSGPYSEVLRND